MDPGGPGGRDRTRATYWMEVDLGRMLGAAIRGLLVDALRKQLVDTMPEKLKGDVEGLSQASRRSADSAAAL